MRFRPPRQLASIRDLDARYDAAWSVFTAAVQITDAVLLVTAGLLKLRTPGAVMAATPALGLPWIVTRGKAGHMRPAVLINTKIELAAALVSPFAWVAAAGLIAVARRLA